MITIYTQKMCNCHPIITKKTQSMANKDGYRCFSSRAE